ncbi:unnamed protein product, partial [Polarella glacialis]
MLCACALLLVMCAAAILALPVPSWEQLSLESRCGLAFGTLLLTSLGWSSMIRFSELHRLELSPLPAKWGPRAALPTEGLAGLASCWLLVPTGLLRAALRATGRPWQLLAEVLRRSPALGTPLAWWEWRELSLGLVFWSSA